MRSTTNVARANASELGLPTAKVVIRFFKNRRFSVDLEHGERIPLGLLEGFIPRVYEAIGMACIKARKEKEANDAV